MVKRLFILFPVTILEKVPDQTKSPVKKEKYRENNAYFLGKITEPCAEKEIECQEKEHGSNRNSKYFGEFSHPGLIL